MIQIRVCASGWYVIQESVLGMDSYMSSFPEFRKCYLVFVSWFTSGRLREEEGSWRWRVINSEKHASGEELVANNVREDGDESDVDEIVHQEVMNECESGAISTEKLS